MIGSFPICCKNLHMKSSFLTPQTSLTQVLSSFVVKTFASKSFFLISQMSFKLGREVTQMPVVIDIQLKSSNKQEIANLLRLSNLKSDHASHHATTQSYATGIHTWQAQSGIEKATL